jgi:hypothetical protein
MTEREEEIPSLPLQTRRRVLGYIVPLISLPVITWKAYSISLLLSQPNPQLSSQEFLNDLVSISFALVLLLLIPRRSPLYTNRYWLTPNGLKITRTFKVANTLPYDIIERLEFFIRDERQGEPSKEALQYARDSVNERRKAGFKFVDYTNDETKIALIYTGDKIYMVTPANPRAFSQRLVKRVNRLSIRTVTLTPRGARVKDSSP